ncbi:MAG: right-handed parallel beta-helix repeat-containing protein, partial [Fibrobacteres bacterium]|nr:right-handed parallel beta-helix repeat-containing protein [Fibrobacterota bacterium]
ITLKNNLRGPNTDGIDVDCSKNVHISDCHIAAGDDCIALKSSVEFFGYDNRACENVVVSNCTLISPCNAIRLGYEGDGPIRNCTFNNIIIPESRTGINILVPTHPEYGIHHGPAIENVLFSNMIMDVKKAFFLWTGDKASSPASLRRIRFDNIIASANRANFIGGSASVPAEEIHFSRVHMSMFGEMKDDFNGVAPDPYGVFGYWTKSGLPYAFYVRNAKKVSFSDVTIDWKRATGKWREALKVEKSEDVIGSLNPKTK